MSEIYLLPKEKLETELGFQEVANETHFDHISRLIDSAPPKTVFPIVDHQPCDDADYVTCLIQLGNGPQDGLILDVRVGTFIALKWIKKN